MKITNKEFYININNGIKEFITNMYGNTFALGTSKNIDFINKELLDNKCTDVEGYVTFLREMMGIKRENTYQLMEIIISAAMTLDELSIDELMRLIYVLESICNQQYIKYRNDLQVVKEKNLSNIHARFNDSNNQLEVRYFRERPSRPYKFVVYELNNHFKTFKYYKEYCKYKNSKYLYASSITKILNCSTELAYKLLDKLAKNGMLIRGYEFMCPCGNHRKRFTTNYINLPDYVTCHECQKERVTRDNIFIACENVKDKKELYKKWGIL